MRFLSVGLNAYEFVKPHRFSTLQATRPTSKFSSSATNSSDELIHNILRSDYHFAPRGTSTERGRGALENYRRRDKTGLAGYHIWRCVVNETSPDHTTLHAEAGDLNPRNKTAASMNLLQKYYQRLFVKSGIGNYDECATVLPELIDKYAVVTLLPH